MRDDRYVVLARSRQAAKNMAQMLIHVVSTADTLCVLLFVYVDVVYVLLL